MARYPLESPQEFDRLEHQTALPQYDPRVELAELELAAGSLVLDAGCGSGAVTRRVAATFPAVTVFGCDRSGSRVRRAAAQAAARTAPAPVFEVGDLTALPHPHGTFDLILLRFVLEHLDPDRRRAVIAEARRCLRPGGAVLVSELDGLFSGVHPQPPEIRQGLDLLRRAGCPGLESGREVAQALLEQGFSDLRVRTVASSFFGPELAAERANYDARFEQARTYLNDVFGSEEAAERFREAYLRTLDEPGAVSFFHRFVVTARAPEQ